MNVANCLVTIAAVILMDRAGRRPLLNVSIVLMALAAALLTVALNLPDPQITAGLAVVAVSDTHAPGGGRHRACPHPS